jgi:DNA-binding GntR family transcriptional regulator
MSGGRFAETKRGRLGDRAAAHVRGLIMAGALQPHEIVRPETIGEALNISSTPSREALQALRVEGFLELDPGVGFRVAELTGDDIRDLFRVQSLIAGELAARAATRGTPDDVAELNALHHEMIAAGARGNLDLLEERNHAFHRQINLMAGSRKVLWALGLLARYVPRAFYSSIPGWPEATTTDHAAVLQAITHRDVDAAREAMQRHIEHAGDLLAANFDARRAAEADTTGAEAVRAVTE